MSVQTKRVYEFGSFRIDTAERVLLREGKPVSLTPKAFEVLILLVESSGHIVEKEELINRVWSDSFVEEGNLKVTVSMLRKVLESPGEQQFIETVPRRGYRFAADVRELSDAGRELMLIERSRTDVTIEEDEESSGESSVKPLRFVHFLEDFVAWIQNRRKLLASELFDSQGLVSLRHYARVCEILAVAANPAQRTQLCSAVHLFGRGNQSTA